MSLASGIYVGRVRHRRTRPRAHDFAYRLHMLYLDLDELDRVFAGHWLWSTGRRNLFAWHRADYFGDPRVPLRDAVLDRVEQDIGVRPRGPVRMLTQLRCFGYCFNPVTFYYCFAADGATLQAILAEITNTPWGERHAYVVDAWQAAAQGGVLVARFDKRFHVSPFMRMEQAYDWRFSTPGDRLAVHMQSAEDGERIFDATLTMSRREIGGMSLARAVLRHPFMTGKVIAGIYWQALRLRLKRVPFHDHPGGVHPAA
ncbi:MAG: DUF1365 domain-containing protein [Planctomycetota bacterium]